jgi:hypothetical protein
MPIVVQGAYLVDLKAESQRNQDLTQQLAGQKAKVKEANGKLKQLQKDHARLLERKLEADRRVTTLQQKLQQLRQRRDAAGSSNNGSGSRSSANGMHAVNTSASGGIAGSGNAGASSRSIGIACKAQPSLLGSFRATSGLQGQQWPGDVQQQASLSQSASMQWPTLQQQQQQPQQQQQQPVVSREVAATEGVSAAFSAEQHARMAAEAKVGFVQWHFSTLGCYYRSLV